MEDDDKAEVLKLLEDMTVDFTVLFSYLRALAATHPDQAKLLQAFEARLETHYVRAMYGAVSDRFVDRVSQRGRLETAALREGRA